MNQNHFLHHLYSPSLYTSKELDTIVSKFEKKLFSKNEYLLRLNNVEEQFWFIEKGTIRSFLFDQNGRDITTQFHASGEVVIDYTSFLMQTPSQENIQALTDCTCWQIDFSSFQELFNSIEPFREHARTLLVGSYNNLKKHHLSIVAEEAKSRYSQLLKEKPHIIQNASLKHIASFLGITDTSLSRIRKELTVD